MSRELLLCLSLCCCVGSVRSFNLTILHTNDVHARYEQTNKYSGQCSSSDAAEGKCYGGFPRLYAKIEELRGRYNNTLLLDGGDQSQGTIWYFKYGANITATFMNLLGYDAMGLGNHEFDQGEKGVDEFLNVAQFPVLSSNLNASQFPDIESRVKRSVVVEVGGERIGIVGYTTTDTAIISNPGKLTFIDEVEALRAEVTSLTSQGVTKVVCVGHAGFKKDLIIARNVSGVDVVVGGHTNTFLYTGTAPAHEEPVGDYPQVIEREDGTRALVVQDYAFAKYLGFLQVEFDDAGEVTSWSGNPILLDNSVPRDAGIQEETVKWRRGVEELTQQIVGSTLVRLEGDRTVCRLQECNMGNMIADALVVQNLRHSDSVEWNHVAIAIFNGGGIRDSISKGDITVANMLSVNPFRNVIDMVELNGSALWSVMEHSASQWDPIEQRGGFLQLSGLHVVYDMSLPVGQRVVSIKVRCADCEVPQMEDLELAKVYKVAMPGFLVRGGDGYSVIAENMIKHHLNGDLDTDVTTEYVKKFSPITQGLEGRIRFVNSSDPHETGNCTHTGSGNGSGDPNGSGSGDPNGNGSGDPNGNGSGDPNGNNQCPTSGAVQTLTSSLGLVVTVLIVVTSFWCPSM